MTKEIRNSKFEVRNKPEIRSANPKWGAGGRGLLPFYFWNSLATRHSSFVIRSRSLLLILTLAGVVIGCTTEKKHKWLTFFFDGVPSPGATNTVRIEYDENGRPLDKTVAPQTNQTV